MTRMWLYPISSKSDYKFRVGNQKWPDNSPESFAEYVRAVGVISREWSITTNFLNVRKGDSIVIYSSKRSNSPPCIVGLGKIHKVDVAYPAIDIRWDKNQTLRLSRWPIDATYLMRNLPSNKAGVMTLSPELAGWIQSRVKKRAALVDKPGSGEKNYRGTTKVVTVRGKKYEAMLRHDPKIIRPMRNRLASKGWETIRGHFAGLETDLLMGSPNDEVLLLVEGKTNLKDQGRAEIRYAIGQILDYEHFVLPGVVETTRWKRIEKLILLEKKPLAGLIPFVESIQINIAWLSGRTIQPGPDTRRRLPEVFDK
jgi:hypothetical protein